jgi:hypothetical protein
MDINLARGYGVISHHQKPLSNEAVFGFSRITKY